MKRLVITSSIMYKAHRLTKAMCEDDSSLDYRLQLSINIKHYMEVEKSNREFKLLQISAYRWIKQRISHNNTIHSEEMHNLISDMNIDLMIKHYYWGESQNAWELSHDLVKNHKANIQKWA